MPAPAAKAIQFAFGYRFPSRGMCVSGSMNLWINGRAESF